MRFQYLYCFGEWESEKAKLWQSPYGYHQTAQEIMESHTLDLLATDFRSERGIWLKDTKHDTPRKFLVQSERKTSYRVREISD